MLVYTENNILILGWIIYNMHLQSRIGQIMQPPTAKLKSRLGKWYIVVDFLNRVAGFVFG